MKNTDIHKIKARLYYLRGQIEADRISWSEVAELQGLADHIAPDDTLLLEWAGVPEGPAPNATRKRQRWCRHITFNHYNKVWHIHFGRGEGGDKEWNTVPRTWKVCPICKQPRPINQKGKPS